MKKLWKKVVAVICAFSMMIAGIGVIPEVQAEDVPTGLTDVRWSDVGITEDTTIVGGCNDANNWGVNEKPVTSGKSLVNSSFRGTLKFRKTTGANLFFQYGTDSINVLGTKGIRFTIGDSGELKVFNMANGGSEVVILDATTAGLSSGTFINTAFELGIDVWQPTDSADLKMIVYIDKQQYGSDPYVITNGAANMDNSALLVAQGEGDFIDVVAEREKAPDNLTNVDWSDVGITEDTTIVGGCNDANNWGVNEKPVTSGKSLVNSSFRGTLKFRKTTGANLFFQYGTDSITVLETKGIRFTIGESGELKVFNMANGGTLIETLDAATAGLSSGTFINTAFELGIDVWQPSGSADLKMIVYINNQQYGSEPYVITNGAANMNAGAVLVSQGEGDFIDVVVEKEKAPDNLTNVNWSDVGITEDTTIVGGASDANNWGVNEKLVTSGKSLVNSSFRGTLRFRRTTTANQYFQYGANSSGNGNKGIRFAMGDSGELKVFNMANGGALVETLDATTAGLSSGTFVGTAFELGIDVWQPTDSADLKMIVYIDKQQYGSDPYVITNGAANMDNSALLVAQGEGDFIDITAAGEKEPSPEDLTKIGWKDFGIAENKTCIASGDAALVTAAEVVQTGISFRGKVKYNRANSADTLMLAFGSTGWDGLRVTQTSDDKLVLQGVGGSSPVSAEITTTQAGVTSFANQEFELGLDIWSVNDTDLKVNVFVNGVQITKKAGVWEGAVTNGYMKMGLCYYITGSSSIVLIPEFEPSPEGLTKIGWKDFGFSGQDYAYTTGGFSALEHCSTVTLKKASFRGVLQFKGAGTRLTYGDNWDGWEHGLNFAPTEEGKLKVWNALDRTNLDVTLEPSKVGITSFLNQEFELGIDSWEDGNDIKFNIFVNGQQYNQSAYMWKDGVKNAYLYPYMTAGLLISGASDSITVEFPVEEPCNLDTTPTGYLLNGSAIRVNDNAAATGDTLTAIGDYRVLYIDETGVTAKNVGCYKPGDAHVDGAINARDLVAVKKEIKKVSESQKSSSVARHYAADVNGDNAYDETDMQWIRNNILGVTNVTPKLVASYSLTEDALEMPIGGFNGPYRVSDRDLITDGIYKTIADCGINFITFTRHSYPTDSNDTENIEITKMQLALAEKYDLGFFVQDHHIQYSTQEWTTEELANRMKWYSNYKSFRGLAIFDEPTLAGVYGSSEEGAGDAFHRRKSVSKLTNSFSNIAAYANMLPLNAAMKLDDSVTDEEAYRTYLTTYCEEYNPKFLSYDNYPFEWKQNAITGTSVKADYYYFKNLAIVREIANQYQIPFWTHVQSGDSFDKGAGGTNAHNPSEGKFKWQINVELAFGAKGIQYFPLVQPDGYELTENGESDYTRNGLIGKDGNTTEWYTYAQEMNQQIRKMDHVLMNSVNKGIMVTGDYATTNMSEANESSNILLSSFDLGGKNPTITGLTTDETNHTYGAIAGCFDYQGKAAVYVVNYNVTASQNITLTWDKSYSYKVLDGNGETAKEPATACTLALGAGEAALLVFE